MEYVAHAEQFTSALGELERARASGALDQRINLALDPIRPVRKRYDLASIELFGAADQNRLEPSTRNQRREDAAWKKTDGLGDQLDELSGVLARAIGAKAQRLQGHVEERNRQIIATILALGVLSAVLVGLIQSAVGRARRGAESARRRAECLLSENQSILNCAGEGILGIDMEGRMTFVNPAASSLTGYPADELVGQSKREMLHHSDLDGKPYPVHESPVSVSLREETVQRAEDEVYWRRDGSSFAVEYTITPITEDGRVRGAVVVFKDVTERREVERAKEEFTSIVSHELRTPLTSIRGSLRLLESGVLGPLPKKGQRLVEVAVQNTDRLVRLINDILDIERIESGRIDLHREPCDAADLIERAVDSIGQLAAAARVSLIAEGEPVALFADPDRVIQTLTNLISNAIKFSSPGACVRVCSAARDGEVLFEVADEGRGIPAANLESIFERFQQVDASASREMGGTGLGLAICRTIVEHHGGRIWVDSTLGTGSTFSFELPAMITARLASGAGNAATG